VSEITAKDLLKLYRRSFLPDEEIIPSNVVEETFLLMLPQLAVDIPSFFLREYKDNLYWDKVCLYCSLSEDDMNEFYELLDWQSIALRQKLSFDFIKTNYDKFKNYLPELLRNKSMDYIRKDLRELFKQYSDLI
jgi:hypothetical protein